MQTARSSRISSYELAAALSPHPVAAAAAGVSIYDAGSEAKVLDLGGGSGAVQAVAFSPRSGFLQVYHKPSASQGDEGDKNLRVYALPSGAVVLASSQKLFSRERWPALQWAADESLLLRAASTEAQLLAPADFPIGASVRLRIAGLSSLSLSPGPTPLLAAFCAEAKGAPASLRVFSVPAATPGAPPVTGGAEAGDQHPLARRSFFRASHAKVKWNPQGSALLALATADVDATNQSYYGESSLHFLRADGATDGAAVPLPKEGPVHDVAWSSKGTEFVAVYGFMPARVTLFSDKLAVLSEITPGPFNTARFNPFGRFLVLGGFGNLPGDVCFFDRKADAKLKLMAETRLANAVSVEWSPCGRFVLAATTAPRLNVDNGFRIVKYTAELVATHAVPAGAHLLQAEWLPLRVPGPSFPDRPQTPGAAAAAKSSPSVVAAAKAAPYRPPGAAARSGGGGGGGGAGGGASTAGAPQFSLAREVQPFLKPGSAERIAAARAAGPPGGEFVGEAPRGAPNGGVASKSAKKRAAAKTKAAGAAYGVAKLDIGK